MTDSAVVDCPPQRGPGRPPGSGKTPGSGRKKGTPNKINREIRQIAGRYTLKALRQAWKLAQEATDQAVQLRAVELLLSYGHGRPAQVQLLGGTGDPIQTQSLVLEVSQRISQVFGQLDTNGDRPVAETLDDDGLRAVQAVSFLQAQAEASTQLAARGGATELSGHPDGPRTDEATQRGSEAESVKTAPVEEPAPPPVDHTLSFVESDYTIRGVEPSRANLPVTYELRRRGGLCRSGPFPLVLDLLRELVGDDLGAWLHQAPRAPGDQFGRADQGPTLAPPPQVHRGHSNRKRRRS